MKAVHNIKNALRSVVIVKYGSIRAYVITIYMGIFQKD